MIEKLKPSPHFDEVTVGQELHNNKGTVSFSLLYPPSSKEHSVGMHERNGRNLYLDIDAARRDKAAELLEIDKAYEEEIILQSSEGYRVGVRIVNKDASNGTIGVMTSWSTDAEWVNSRGIVESLALTYPDMRIIYIETPGMGGSENLSEDRFKEMKKKENKGSYKPMAEQIAPALDEAGIHFDYFWGVSEGARIVTSLASELATV